MIKTFFFLSFTKALNTYLQLDTESKTRLQKLSGKTATIEWLPFHFIFQCHFLESGVKIYTDDLLPDDVRICCTPLQMLTLMIVKDEQNQFAEGSIEIKGNAEIGQQVLALFRELQLDYEEYLSYLIGDAPAAHAGRAAGQMSNWFQHAKESLFDNLSEYLHEEVEWFPCREALSDFFAEIDTLRMDVDRVEASINQLKASLEKEVI